MFNSHIRLTMTLMKRYLPPTIAPNQVTACLGLISDTHMPQRWRKLPTAVSHIFSGVDHILHAGDVGELWVLDELSQIAPVTAVHGNDETKTATRELPYQQLLTIAGRRILIWHSHYPDRIDEMAARKGDNFYNKLERSVQRGKRAGASIVIFGHWHIPLQYEKDGILVINPGAIASGGFAVKQAVQTVALLFLLENGRFHITHIDLAHPDDIYQPPTHFDIGFVANLAKYTETILSPELTAVQDQFFPQLYPLAPKILTDIWFRLAHECWEGERDMITSELLLTQIQQHTTLPDTKKQQITATLMQIINGRSTKKDPPE